MRALLTRRTAVSPGTLVVGVLLIAACLRVPVTGVPPLLGALRSDLGLSTSSAGLLTTVPLLVFALVSPISPALSRRYGLERTLFGALLAIALGIVLRSSGDTTMLFLGTVIIGSGIALGNVLVPSVVKRDYPSRIATMTGAYTLAMYLPAALGSAIAAPMAEAWGWQIALMSFAALPVMAMGDWYLRLGKDSISPSATYRVRILRSGGLRLRGI